MRYEGDARYIYASILIEVKFDMDKIFMMGWKTLAVGIGLSALVGSIYRSEMKRLSARQQNESHLAMTPQGIVEYAVTGEGQAVLISHSASGGYDQGLATAKRFPDFRVIAPSRSGYLRTPLETALTPHDMARAYAGLLDVLNIDKTIVIGWSAGAMSAIEFALHYPERCCALILGGAVTKPPPAYVLDIFAPVVLANRSDFLNWVMGKVATSVVLPLTERDLETREILRVFAAANPASKRLAGFKQDVDHMRCFHPPLEEICVPTLLIHGTNDILVPISHIQLAAARIPNAQLLIIRGGQHDCPIRHPAQVSLAIKRFVGKAKD